MGKTMHIRLPRMRHTVYRLPVLILAPGSCLLPCMQTALGLRETHPTARSRVFADLDRLRAMRAPDAGIIAVVQRVVGKVMIADVFPNLFRSPIGQRIDLNHPKLRVPAELAGAGALRRLIAADGGEPGVQLGEFLSQRLQFSQIAAAVGVAVPE